MSDQKERTAVTFGEEMADKFAQWWREETFFQWERACKLCESEIEKALVAGLMWSARNTYVWWNRPPLFYGGGQPTSNAPEFDGLHIWPQAKISKYRADFLIIAREDGKTARVVVECDGHDFHERTKQQAQRDKQRDRDMVAMGFTVLRFTGSEIWRDTDVCADSVYDIILKQLGLE